MAKRIKLDNQRIALESVDFKRIPKSSENSKPFLEDKILDFVIDDDSVFILYERTFYAVPASIMNLSIKFTYRASFNKEKTEFLSESEDKESIARKIIKNTNICSVASLVIANITSINSGNPLVTPPMFIENKQ